MNEKHFLDRYINDVSAFSNDWRYGLNSIEGRVGNLHTFLEEHEVLNNIKNALSKTVVIKKSRQVHATNILSVYALWETMFNENHKTLYMTHDRNSADMFLRMVKYHMGNIRNNIGINKYVSYDERKSRINFKHVNSEIMTCAATKNMWRGRRVNLLIIDEAAFIDDLESTYKSSAPCLWGEETGKSIICSTPKKGSDFFDALCQKAMLSDTIWDIRCGTSYINMCNNNTVNPFLD